MKAGRPAIEGDGGARHRGRVETRPTRRRGRIVVQCVYRPRATTVGGGQARLLPSGALRLYSLARSCISPRGGGPRRAGVALLGGAASTLGTVSEQSGNVLCQGLVAILLLSGGCSRRALGTSPDGAASGPRLLVVRTPAALSIARGIDSLSVAVDPASLGLIQVATDAGMRIGVEREVFVFPVGQGRPDAGRRGLAPSADFTASTDTWKTSEDGIPLAGTKYVVEVQLILFETAVPPANEWNPHAGEFKALWSRTIRQSEE